MCAFSWTVISWKISTFCSMWFAAPPRMWWWFSRLNCSSVSGVLEKLPLLLPLGKKLFFFGNDELFEWKPQSKKLPRMNLSVFCFWPTKAHKNKIETIPLVCDGFRRLTSAQMMAIPSLWTVQQTQMLANHGITIDDVLWQVLFANHLLNGVLMYDFEPNLYSDTRGSYLD